MSEIHDVARNAAELARVDLNLLVVFDALVRERSVTRAAERVGVTQSAASHALNRLRALLADPLLVRGRAGMELTPRAESLSVPVRSALVILGRALAEPAEFEAGSARRAFCVATPDLFDVLAVPRLLERVRVEAPGVDVRIVPAGDRRLASQLETGEVDAAIVPAMDKAEPGEAPNDAPLGLVRRTLLRDGFVCFLRGGHPALTRRSGDRGRRLGKGLSLDTYLTLSHALVSPGGEGGAPVDAALAQRGRARRVALRIPHFYSALAIVAKSDLVLTAPSALAALAPELGVVAMPAPLPLPRHTVNLTWHERFSNDPGHRWFRTLLASVAEASRLRA